MPPARSAAARKSARSCAARVSRMAARASSAGRVGDLVGVREGDDHARREGGSERADDEIDRLFVLEAESTIGGDVGVHHGVVIGDVGGEFAEDAGGVRPSTS